MFIAVMALSPFCMVFDYCQESFERICRPELDAKTRERMPLVPNVAYQGIASALVARDASQV